MSYRNSMTNCKHDDSNGICTRSLDFRLSIIQQLDKSFKDVQRNSFIYLLTE